MIDIPSLAEILTWFQTNSLKVIQTASSAVGFVVIIGAPLANFLKYVQTRAFAQKVDLTISGTVYTNNQDTYLHIAVKMKNIGASRILINPAPSYILVKTLEETSAPLTLIPADVFELLDVFQHQSSLEAGESADDFVLLKLAHGNYLAFRVEVGVVSLGRRTPFKWNNEQRLGREWLQTAVINCKLQ